VVEGIEVGRGLPDSLILWSSQLISLFDFTVHFGRWSRKGSISPPSTGHSTKFLLYHMPDAQMERSQPHPTSAPAICNQNQNLACKYGSSRCSIYVISPQYVTIRTHACNYTLWFRSRVIEPRRCSCRNLKWHLHSGPCASAI
jgi:hypothetical protein